MDSHNFEKPELLSPLGLAYLGDSVFELIVREYILNNYGENVNNLHKHTTSIVSAAAQSEFYSQLLGFLNDKELSVMKRGRNAKVGSVPKNSSVQDYHNATGFEALMGYLYLSGDYQRIREIFDFTVRKKL